MAQRVAQEMQCTLGRDVGYQVRFDDCTTQVRDDDGPAENQLGPNLIIGGIFDNMNLCLSLGHGGEVHDRWLFAQRDPGRPCSFSVQCCNLG